MEKCKTRSPVIFIMSSIYSRNEEILRNWEEESSVRYKEKKFFVPDGIMNRGEFCDCTGSISCKRLPSKDFKIETETWEKAPMRYLYITKDLNASNGIWKVREEVGGRKSKNSDKIGNNFHKNIIYQLYGLSHTTPQGKVSWDDENFTDENALKFYDTCAFARINVKKQAGGEKIHDLTLKKYMNRYSCFLKFQIKNLDADIIVCGGSNEGKNLILDFLIKECYIDLTPVDPENGWIYYSEKYNKIAIDSWHPSCRKAIEEIYGKMMDAYYSFLKNVKPEFINPHR